jgi:hypothetical protein
MHEEKMKFVDIPYGIYTVVETLVADFLENIENAIREKI